MNQRLTTKLAITPGLAPGYPDGKRPRCRGPTSVRLFRRR